MASPHLHTNKTLRALQVKVPRPQAEAEEERTIATYDLWTWLMGEVRQALEPITPAGSPGIGR